MKVTTTVATLLAAFLALAPMAALASAHENDKVTNYTDWPKPTKDVVKVEEVPVLDHQAKYEEPKPEVARQDTHFQYENGRR